MSKSVKKNISRFFILLLLFSLFPFQTIQATSTTNLSNSEETINEENLLPYTSLEDIEVSNESNEKVFQISKGTTFFVSHVTEEEAYVNIEQDTFAIPLTSIENYDSSEQNLLPVNSENGLLAEPTSEGIIVYDSSDFESTLGSIYSIFPLNVIEENEEYWTIAFLNRSGFVKKTDLVLLEEESNDSDLDGESTSEEQEPNGDQSSTKTNEEENVSEQKEDLTTVEEQKSINENQASTTTSEQEDKNSEAVTNKENSPLISESVTTEANVIQKVEETKPKLQITAAYGTYFKVTTDKLPVYDNRSGSLQLVGYLEKGQEYPRVSDYGAWHRIQFGDIYGYVRKTGTTPSNGTTIKNSTNPSIKPIGKLTVTKNAPIYDNTSGRLVAFATLNAGQFYPILSDYGTWFKISVSGRTGYIHKSAVIEHFRNSHSYFTVKSDHLPVYKNLNGKLVRIGVLRAGQTYERESDYGSWHKVNFDGQVGFVWQYSTIPASDNSIAISTSKTTTGFKFKTLDSTSVYDNSSGGLVEFAKIDSNQIINVTRDYGNWWKVELLGRIGYVQKTKVQSIYQSTDSLFKVIQDKTPIYTNYNGQLIVVGKLEKNQVYPILEDYGNWLRVQFGHQQAYVWKSATQPVREHVSLNLRANESWLDYSFTTRSLTTVYDNSGGKLVPFATLEAGRYYPILEDYGHWWKTSVLGRIGYVSKNSVLADTPIKYRSYDLSLNEMVAIQMTKSPQTDKYRNEPAYVHKNYINLTSSTKGVVTANVLNVREMPTASSHKYGTLSNNAVVTITGTFGDWYEINYSTWRIAKAEDVAASLDPKIYNEDDAEFYQFLLLDRSSQTPASELNKLLVDKGILEGRGHAFGTAGAVHSINEVYLISHALLETGNGKGSSLAKGKLVTEVDGVTVEPKVVYNMYGIGALDKCPEKCGSEFAYKEGWFTPDAAIIGGAKFIAERYIYSEKYGFQNTLYKMRWNPANPGTHQYATDIGWTLKQVWKYQQLERYTTQYFEVPVYLQ